MSEKKSNDDRMGNVGITDFEKHVQDAGLAAREERRENPGMLDQISGRIADTLGASGASNDTDLSIQGMRDRLQNFVKGGEANEDDPGKLSMQDSEHQPGKTVPTKVMDEGADEEHGKDLNRSRFKE